MDATVVRIHVILPAVSGDRRGLRVIRGRWGRREYKGIPGVPVLKATKAIRALWGRRAFPALPVREVPEEIRDR